MLSIGLPLLIFNLLALFLQHLKRVSSRFMVLFVASWLFKNHEVKLHVLSAFYFTIIPPDGVYAYQAYKLYRIAATLGVSFDSLTEFYARNGWLRLRSKSS